MNTKITIYRAAQVGGQITKIVTKNATIMIDCGENLPGVLDEDKYQNSEKIASITDGVDAIFIRIIMPTILVWGIMCQPKFCNI